MPDAATILRDYLDSLYRIRRTGQAVPETSYYGAMETLFNAIGQALGQLAGILCAEYAESRRGYPRWWSVPR